MSEANATNATNEADWVLVRWAKGVDVFTPYLDGPRHWASGVEGFSADWVEIASGTYDYIKALRRMLETEKDTEGNNVR